MDVDLYILKSVVEYKLVVGSVWYFERLFIDKDVQ